MRAFSQTQSQLEKKSLPNSKSQHTAVLRQDSHPILHLQRTIGNQAVQKLFRQSQAGNQQQASPSDNKVSKGTREECINKNAPFGGEVTNDSDTYWWVSGCTNSKLEDFYVLVAGQNSDDSDAIKTGLDGDVDAVWPNGKSIKNGKTGKVVNNGVFKLSSARNANIEGDAKSGYVISDFTQYFAEGSLPTGWALPKELKKG